MQKIKLNPIIIILIGVTAAQILSTLHLYLSNTSLFHTIKAISDLGYLAIPNAHVMPLLTKFAPAFYGGLFFSLTIGISLTLLTFAGVRIWDRMTGRNKTFLFLLCIGWIGGMGAVNINGPVLMPTAYFLIIPPLVFWLCLHASENRQTSESLDPKTRFNIICQLIFFITLIIAGSTQMKPAFFSKIRDNFLLSDNWGIKINTFYYDYTLYAAQVFKSLEQKTLKTCELSLSDDPSYLRGSQNSGGLFMEKLLLNHDYLIIPNGTIPADLYIVRNKTDLLFKEKHKTVFQITQDEFFRDPLKILREFSQKTDRYIFFRQITFFSILFSSAVSFYLFGYLFFYMLLGFFFKLFPMTKQNFVIPSSVIAGGFCLLIGVGLLIFLSFGEKAFSHTDELADALASDNCRSRVAALQFIFQKKIEIAQFPSYLRITDRPCIPERYRLAKVLAKSRSSDTYPILTALLDDANFNVVYNAFYALGKRGDKYAVKEILGRIKISDNWYVQWYAYRALRRLGWTQTRLK